ncbi:MAG: AraC family transcriptional regulator [Clostridia bacterium]
MNNILTNFNYKNEAISANSRCPHLHRGYQIIFITNGIVEMQIEEKNYNITAPAIILLNAFEKHLLKNASDNFCRYIIELEPLQIENTLDFNIVNMLKLRPIDFNHLLILEQSNANKILQMFEFIKSEVECAQSLSSLIISAEITKLLVSIYRIFPIKNKECFNELALNIRQFIDANFADNIDVSTIAKEFFISTSYLSHIFKIYSGYSVKQYVINTRLFNAQFLLLHTNNSIKKISFLCGYNDINNFIRQFKTQYLLSPLQYRKTKNLL